MKKLITIFLTCFTFSLFAQVVIVSSGCYVASDNVSTSGGNGGTGAGIGIGVGGRNILTGKNGSNDVRIIFVTSPASRWEIQYVISGVVSTDFYSTAQTNPKPPNTSIGNWQKLNNSCGTLTLTTSSGDLETVLPIELMSFDAQNTEGSKNTLTWATASEVNNKGFDIERSRDGNTFQSIGNVKGIGKAATYNFVDANPFNGVNYYRLKQVDFDGTETLSKVVSVTTTGKGTSKIKIFPTNTEGSIFIESGQLTIDNVQVFNNVGQLVLSGSATSRLDLSAMPSGLYLVQVKAGGEVATEKVFKN